MSWFPDLASAGNSRGVKGFYIHSIPAFKKNFLEVEASTQAFYSSKSVTVFPLI